MTDDAHLGPSLSAYLDGELAPAALRDTEVHLGRCPECREELEDVRYARSALRSLPVRSGPGAAPASVPLEVRRVTRWLWGGLALAAAVGAFLLPTEPEVTPVVPELVDAHATRASVSGEPLTHLAPIAVRYAP